MQPGHHETAQVELQEQINTGWLLACSALVFIMQAGFCCLETGLVRTKNSINVAIKNLVDLCIAGLLFWGFGYAFMFGPTLAGWIGSDGFCFESVDPERMGIFLFQLMFCGAATTIVAGAVAERMRFSGYIIVTVLISGIIYPLYGHWAWGQGGWLAELGFRDFAGSTVVHGAGAWVALAACLVIGPRIGRFETDNRSRLIGNNLPMAALGVMLLWFGWIGFNGGSGLMINESVPGIVTATMLSAMAGGISALTMSWSIRRHPDVLQVINGILAGLVAITASCNVVSLLAAILIGAIGGVIAVSANSVLEKFRVDDAVSAIGVHGFAGVWGTLAVALFASPDRLGTGLSFWEQFGVQCVGSYICFAWAFGGGYCVLRLLNRAYSLRVSPDDEQVGLNVSEHHVKTETDLLVAEMEAQRNSCDYTNPVALESYSEIGQIASQYNRVLAVVSAERSKLVAANQVAQAANADLTMAQTALQAKLDELAQFNELAVDREMRMVDLKVEVNALSARLGKPMPYDMTIDHPQATEV